MTEMSPAEAIFFAAAALPTPERASYLAQVCAGRDSLRQRVEQMLAAQPVVGSFLESPARAGEATSAHVPKGQPATEDHGDPTAWIGSILAGKYKLIEVIGEGGMGSVYMAQQTEPVRRVVAVKVIKAGMDSHAVLARFEAERQALAMMDHPNIAKVLDAGTTEFGRPFFVMELVKGVPITQFCDARKLTPRQRLELFVPVCQALQHAHQKGIIHRDIKPSNVLVALYDDRPVPKVIDFGVAKAAGQPLTDKTLMTGYGAIVGTPEYMSPEQASFNQLDVDTRSDVYSLGVLLYELLTGTTPVDRKSLGKAAILEILRIVREEEAPPPSVKLSTAEALPSIAANRGTEPAKLTNLLKGELDWVLLKALEKDCARRYETANGLARDIQRYLADEVVEARPPSAGYRLRKFVKRHKGQVIAASLVLVALLAGIAGTVAGLIEARQNETAAVAARNDLEKKNTELEQSQDRLEVALARTWLSPLAEAPGPLNDAEIAAFTEVAAQRDERLAGRFVTEALGSRQGTRKLAARAAFAMHAVVGLDSRKRQEMERQLLSAPMAAGWAADDRTDRARLAAALGGLSPRAAAGVADSLLLTLGKSNNPQAIGFLPSLTALVPYLDPRDTARVFAALTRILTETKDEATGRQLVQGLAALAVRLEPAEAAKVAATLTEAMAGTNPSLAETALSPGLVALALRLGPTEAAQAAATLTQAMQRTKIPSPS